MRIAIMQPYFLPYIGYFQLINAVDVFVIYDNIQYTKKGWINRNRYLHNNEGTYFTIPLKKDSDFLEVRERYISSDFNKSKLLNQITMAYKKALYFEEGFALFEKVIMQNEVQLFKFLYYSNKEVLNKLGINTEIVISSTIDMDHNLKGKEKVIEICRKLGANEYINSIGGQKLYNYADFYKYGIDLKFLKTEKVEYKQFGNEFITNLSIIDIIMFNNRDEISSYLSQQYKLI